MKFDFEKHVPKKEDKKDEIEKVEELTEEEKLARQEKFEQECIAEAERLEIGLEELQNNINNIGGPEQLEQYIEYNESNRQYQESNAEMHTKMAAVLGALPGFIGAMGAMVAFNGNAQAFAQMTYKFARENQIDIPSMGQLLIENPGVLSAAVIAIPAAVAGIVGKIRERGIKRKLAREQDVDNLTKKMAGLNE